MKLIPEYRRVDDLYCLVGTPLEEKMFDYLKYLTAKAIEEYQNVDL
jgi:hypothetical protein